MSIFHKALRWAVWWLLLALLTYGLLSPQAPEAGRILLPTETAFYVSKSVHVGAYGFLAALAGWLPAGRRALAALWLLLLAHGAGTEYLQDFVEGRFSSWRDVVLDTAGVTLGAALVWLYRWWRRPASPAGPAASATATATAPPRPPRG
jgi:VanZ family protein